MPKGPWIIPRLSTIPPLSKQTEEEVRSRWEKCPSSGKPKEICEAYKAVALQILEGGGIFDQCDTLAKINGGSCARAADRVYDRVDGVRVMKIGENDHFWIEYNGRHYDAEVPSGVDDPFDLPILRDAPLDSMLSLSQLAAEAEGRERPQSMRETITDVTDTRY